MVLELVLTGVAGAVVGGVLAGRQLHKPLAGVLLGAAVGLAGGYFIFHEPPAVLAVETAEEGMERLRRRDYDVIIVDYRLPGMDGLEFLDRIRDSHPNTLTLFITAYGSRAVVSKATELGVKGFIDKPFTIEMLEKALSRLIAQGEARC